MHKKCSKYTFIIQLITTSSLQSKHNKICILKEISAVGPVSSFSIRSIIRRGTIFLLNFKFNTLIAIRLSAKKKKFFRISAKTQNLSERSLATPLFLVAIITFVHWPCTRSHCTCSHCTCSHCTCSHCTFSPSNALVPQANVLVPQAILIALVALAMLLFSKQFNFFIALVPQAMQFFLLHLFPKQCSFSYCTSSPSNALVPQTMHQLPQAMH